MADYIKGEKPRDLDGAVGGLVLKRTQSWQKNPDPDMHPLGTGLNGPFNTQDHSKSGSKPDPMAKRSGDKCLPTVKPRK